MRIQPVIFAIAATSIARFAFADTVLYNNNTPTNQMAMASRPDTPGSIETEAADDFILASPATLNTITFTGLVVPSGQSTPTVGDINLEIYRVFPNDSTNPPSGNVPTRTNSPGDDAFTEHDLTSGDITITSSTVATNFTALNSVLNGINKVPNQTTGGEGPVTGTETQFTATFQIPVALPADHYFLVPQVQVTGGQFYWLSASRPISGVGTTPITPDLQAWIRNANLDPDWLRVGTDIVGGSTPPTFNAAFSITGTTTPEPASLALFLIGCSCLTRRRRSA